MLSFPKDLSDANAAACLKYSLEAGMATEEDARNWALAIVDSVADPSCEIVEVLASRTFADLLDKLSQVPGDPDTKLVGRLLLCNLGKVLPDDPAGLGATLRRAMQVVRSTGLDDDDYYLFDAVDDSLNLALSGTYGSLADCRRDLADAFDRYRLQCL